MTVSVTCSCLLMALPLVPAAGMGPCGWVNRPDWEFPRSGSRLGKVWPKVPCTYNRYIHNWVSVSKPHLLVLTCKPHTVRSWVMSICHGCDIIRPENDIHSAWTCMYGKLHTVNYLRMQYNMRMKHLHLDACKYCVCSTAGALRMQPLRGCTGTRMKV